MSLRLTADLALPAFVAGFLGIAVAPHSHGLGRLLAVAAILAVAAHAVLSRFRARRAEAAMAGAAKAIENASCATRAVQTAIEHQAVPALEKLLTATGSLTSDRRVSATVRSRLSPIQAAGEHARSILQAIVGAPGAERAAPPVAAEAWENFAQTEVESAPLPAFAAMRPASGQPLRVLAAEANGVHQLVLRTLLAQIGMEVEFVTNGDELIEAWRREDWDLILMDAQTPEIDGPTAARMIRSVEVKFGWKGTPIVALATHPSARDVDGYAEAGIDVWVSKPIVGASLFEAIETAMAAPAVAAAWEPMELAEVA
ncbi:response regulator [Phenylobacterium sp.]|uniref:response regulator n=1 Tax=Phenylobacterium sp. TaxID=1871053 RepID=UPI0025F49729|nr:response regulator [Phenylobacterium sp.]